MAKRILSIILTVLMLCNVCIISASAESESDYHASWSLKADTDNPQPGDTVTVEVGAKTDYPAMIATAIIAFDSTYYTIVGSGKTAFSICEDYDGIVNVSGVTTSPKGMYHPSYTADMQAKYKLLYAGITFTATSTGDPDYEYPVWRGEYHYFMSFKLKVKTDAPKDGQGLIWMDPVYQRSEEFKATNTTKIVRASGGPTIADNPTAADQVAFGQTVSFTDAVLFKPEEQACDHATTTVVGKKDATCTEPGYTGDTVCSKCNETLSSGQVINATGHKSNDGVVTTPSTCTENGVRTYSCTVCNTVLRTETIYATGHNWDEGEEITPATCTEKGKTLYTCLECDDTQEVEEPALGHVAGEWEVSVPATCTETGTKVKKCTVCGEEVDSQIIYATGHKSDKGVITTPATCTVDGVKTFSCTVCGEAIRTETVYATGHSWGNWYVTRPATSELEGEEERTCLNCGEKDHRPIEKLPSEYADYAVVEAALAKVPKDLSKYTAATVQPVNDAVNAVVYGLAAEKQAQVDAYAKAIEDAVAGLKLIPSTFADYKALDDYIAAYVPSEVNREIGIYNNDDLELLDALIESFDRELGTDEQSVVDGYLASLKSAVSALKADESKAVTEYTVTTDADRYAKGDIVTVSVALKTNYPIGTIQLPIFFNRSAYELVGSGSTFATSKGTLNGKYKLNASATPGSASTYWRRNSNTSYWTTTGKADYNVCQIAYAIDTSVNATPVVLSESEVIATFQLKAITDVDDTVGTIMLSNDWLRTSSTTSGVMFVSRALGEKLNSSAIVDRGQTADLENATAKPIINYTGPACIHEWDDGIVITYATCTSVGSKKVTCNLCGETDTVEVSMVPHTKNAGVMTVPVTCTESGVKTYSCVVCKTVLETEVVKATGHTEVKLEAVEVTCTVNGLTEGKKCSVCNEILVKQNVITAPGHNEITLTGKQATCTEDGLTDGKQCTVCEEITVKQTVINALGHTSNGGVVTSEPTCTAQGIKLYTCTVCNAFIKTELINAKGHTEQTVTGKAATCTEDGLTDGKVCTVCNTVTKNQTVIKATGHTESGSVVQPATCSSTGMMLYVCKDCNAFIRTETIEKTAHTPVTVKGTPATCTTAGLSDGIKCSVCNAVIQEQTATTPIPHTEITVKGTPATCTASGLTDGKKCSVCGTVTVTQQTINPIAHTEITVKGTPATCTAPGLTDGKKCSVCNTVTVAQQTISATGHNVGNWTADSASSDYQKKLCTVCSTEMQTVKVVDDIIVTNGSLTKTGNTIYLNGTLDAANVKITTYRQSDDQKTAATQSVVVATTGTSIKLASDKLSYTLSAKDCTFSATSDTREQATVSTTITVSGIEYNLVITLTNTVEPVTTDVVFEAEEGSTTVIDEENKFIYGLEEGIMDLEGFVYYKNCTLEYHETEAGFGTGTTVDVICEGKVIDTYTIVIFGDVTGDGYIDSFDAAYLISVANFEIEIDEDSAYYMAGDLTNDGFIDSFDSAQLISASNFEFEVSQSR